YLCMYSIARMEWGDLVEEKYKPVAKIFGFFVGPLIMFMFHFADIMRRFHEGEIDLAQIPKLLFCITQGIKRKARQKNRRFIQILDSSGKIALESEGNKSNADVDRVTLDALEDMILNALDDRTTDILIDPKTDGTHTVRFRVDGFLQVVDDMEDDKCKPIVNCVKAISRMDIAEKRRPQDGAFMARMEDGNVSFRVASSGVLGGEKLSIRILNQSSGIMQLKDLGLSKEVYAIAANAIKQQSGMILICGPTGSGKTTSLYAMLSTVDFYARNVITVEDPIEHVMPHASQIEVNIKAEITFAKALRSILRQDPDIITIGEIRDNETAGIAFQASQTGHLVLATLHSSSNMGTLVRLMDLGVKPLLIASALSVIISQRLVRRLCKKCKKVAKISEANAARFRQKGMDPSKVHMAIGCDKCANTGYKGRLPIVDVMVLDANLKARLTNPNVSIGDLKKDGDQKSKSSLREDGIRKVMAGLTTLEEVKRVTTNLG
ncbi:MAG: type II/IV secretion system protein, partial [Planctomycetes bacterium]|nr:type II/IV secretion system protein [Planctomycetota bacterium]